MTASFFVPGEPKAQPRVKAFRRGKFTGVYTPKTADKWKQDVAKAWLENGAPKFGDGPLQVGLYFTIARPKSHYKANGLLKPSAPKEHVSRPDGENLSKGTCDQLTKCGAWKDDSQIVRLTISKHWAHAGQGGCAISISDI